MARTVRDTNLETRTARLRLAVRGKPYYRLIDQGCHLGYRRNKRGAGVWVARRFLGERRYKVQKLGQADDVRDADGVEVLGFGQAQAEARAWFAREARRAAGLEQASTEGAVTVAIAMSEYLDWYAAHRKALGASRNAAETHILPALGKVEVTKLTTAKIQQWHKALAEAPARVRTGLGDDQRHREVSTDPEKLRARQSTANRVLTILRAALNKAFRDGRVASDQAWKRVKPFRGADAARVRYLAEDECRRLLNACTDDFRRLVRGALITGCRYGELARMTVADFNRDAGTLLVREAKAGKPRWVPLDDEAAAFLKAITAGRPGHSRLFLRTDGKVWGKSHQARPLALACQGARIEPPANFHCLRHTWASHRIMRGMPLLAVAQVLGHADTRMVEKHYGHLAPSYIRDAVRATALDLGPYDSGVTPIKLAQKD